MINSLNLIILKKYYFDLNKKNKKKELFIYFPFFLLLPINILRAISPANITITIAAT